VEAHFRKDNMWEITENKITPAVFLVTIGRQSLTEFQFKQMKNKALVFLIMAVKDNLVSTVAEFADPADVWKENMTSSKLEMSHN
jgi:hypothetical protein